MGSKFKSSIELSKHEEPGVPEANGLKIYADEKNILNIVSTGGTKSILDESILPLSIEHGGTGASKLEDIAGSIGALSNTVMVNGKLLADNPVLSTSDIEETDNRKYNIQSDWEAVDGECAILNKPVLGQVSVEDIVPVSKGGTGLYELGTPGQVLSVNQEGTGMIWSTGGGGSAGGMDNPMTGTGDLIVGGVNGTPEKLGIGTAGQVLTVNTTSDALQWTDPVTPPAGMDNPMTTAGDLIVGEENGTPSRLGIGTAGQVLMVNVDSNGLQWTDLDIPSEGMDNPMTAAGDLIVSGENGVPGRLGIGTAGQVLTVNTTSDALQWTDPVTPPAGMDNPMTTAGDLIVSGENGTPSRLGIGTAGQVLSINETGDGLVWSTIEAGGMANPMTTLGDIIIGGASGKPRRLRSPTTDGAYLLNSYVDDGRASIQWSSGVLVTSTWNSGANGFYRQYSDGWIEQGGIVDAGVKEISLYISMRYDTYTVLCNTIGEATDKTVMESQICPIKTTYSSITFSAASSAKRRWYVCGF